MNRRTLLQTLVLSAALAPFLANAHSDDGSPGAVYTASNAADGNEILVYHRNARGELTLGQSVDTGGLGTGAGLGNQGGVMLTENGRWLLAVNAGSDSVSLFFVGHRGPRLVDTVTSGGQRPVSIAVHHSLVYVLNAGGAVGGEDNVTGFRLLPWGRLHPIPNSTAPLSAANTGPAQISFSPRGLHLVVTEKATDGIDVYSLNRSGRIVGHEAFESIGRTPFGFAFDRKGNLFVSEAFGGAPDASAVTSYDLLRDGSLETISPSVPTTETAACWVVVTGNGKYVYTTNTGSNTVSGYSVNRWGEIALLDDDGATGATGMAPIDAALSRNSRYLYTLNAGDGSISVFAVGADGSLHPVQTVVGLPAGTNGLAAQ